MELKQLLTEIENYKTEQFSLPEPRREILSVQPLSDADCEIMDDMLYLCTSEVFGKLRIRADMCASFLIYGDNPRNIIWDAPRHRSNVILLLDVRDPMPILTRLSSPLAAQQRTATAMRQLDSALFANRGLQSLISAAFDVLQNPIFVTDSTAKYIAWSYDESRIKPDSEFANFITSDIIDGSSIDGFGQAFITKNNLTEIISQRTTPYIFFNESFGADSIIASVRIQNVTVGQVYMIAYNREFTDFDYRIFAHLVGLVGQEMQKDEFYVRNRREASAYFLTDLFSNNYMNRESINRRLLSLNYKALESLFVLILRPRQHHESDTPLEILLGQLRGALRGHLSAIIDGRLAILLNYSRRRAPDEELMAELRKQAEMSDLVIGVSNEFSDLADAPHYFAQAESALYMGLKFRPAENVNYYHEVNDFALLDRLGSSYRLEALIHPDIPVLMESDKNNHTDYTETLREYLACACNVQRTAAALHVHKNTLLYRLNKIKAMLETTLEDGLELYRYQLSFRVIAMLEGAV